MGDQQIMDPMGNAENAEMDPSMVVEENEEKSLIKKWEMEHRDKLKDKRNTARAEKEKLIEQAKTDIEKFYEERKDKQANIKTQNKEHEQRYFQEMKDLMQYGAPWEKVGRLVNLTPKPNEKPGTSKVGRMRRLLIQLKNEKNLIKNEHDHFHTFIFWMDACFVAKWLIKDHLRLSRASHLSRICVCI